MIQEIASLATAVGVLVAAGSLIAQNRQRKSDLALKYIERYWQIDDSVRKDTEADSIEKQMHLSRYWRLCEDEFDIARVGWIDGRTWSFWHDGIHLAVADHPEITSYNFPNLALCRESDSHRAWRCPGLQGMGWWRSIVTRCLANIYREQHMPPFGNEVPGISGRNHLSALDERG